MLVEGIPFSLIGGIFFYIYTRKEKEIKRLNLQVITFAARATRTEDNMILTEDSPFPAWRKDARGRMVWLSKSYIKNYLQPNGLEEEDYLGKTDIEVWGEEIGGEYYRNDREMVARNEMIVVKENIKGNGQHVIIKWPSYGRENQIYINGMSFPEQIFKSIV